MMTNLFSTFDPTSSVMSLSINWLSYYLGLSLIHTSFWFLPSRATILLNMLTKTFHSELKTILGPQNTHKGTAFLLLPYLHLLYLMIL